MTRRVVFDTNVFISAYGFGGKPVDLMRAAIEGEIELVTSPAILTEVADKLYSVLDFDDEHVRAAVMQLARIAEIVRPESHLDVIDDDADNRVLEAAVDAGVDAIVTGDHHLLDLGSFEGVRIEKVARAHRRLKSSKG